MHVSKPRNRINHTLEDLKSIPLYPGTFLAEGLNKVSEINKIKYLLNSGLNGSLIEVV